MRSEKTKVRAGGLGAAVRQNFGSGELEDNSGMAAAVGGCPGYNTGCRSFQLGGRVKFAGGQGLLDLFYLGGDISG